MAAPDFSHCGKDTPCLLPLSGAVPRPSRSRAGAVYYVRDAFSSGPREATVRCRAAGAGPRHAAGLVQSVLSAIAIAPLDGPQGTTGTSGHFPELSSRSQVAAALPPRCCDWMDASVFSNEASQSSGGPGSENLAMRDHSGQKDRGRALGKLRAVITHAIRYPYAVTYRTREAPMRKTSSGHRVDQAERALGEVPPLHSYPSSRPGRRCMAPKLLLLSAKRGELGVYSS